MKTSDKDLRPPMYVIAEDETSRCPLQVEGGTGGSILKDTAGLYREMQIINYLLVPIVIIAASGVRTIVQPEFDSAHKPRVEIRHRLVSGRRSLDEYRRDDTKNPHHIRVLPRDVLNESPVYVREQDLLICLVEHSERALHPNSAQQREADRRRLLQALCENAVEGPLLIVANDPRGRHNYVYTNIHGRICAATVRHCRGEGEQDEITVIARDAVAADRVEPQVILQTSFRELAEVGVMVCNGVELALSKEQLRIHNEISDTERTRGVISIAQHERVVEQLKAGHQKDRAELDEQLKRLQQAHTTIKSQLRELEDLNVSGRAAALRQQELEVEALALENKRDLVIHDRAKSEDRAAHELEIARIKRTESLIGTLGSVVKTIGVGATVGLAIWKATAK